MMKGPEIGCNVVIPIPSTFHLGMISTIYRDVGDGSWFRVCHITLKMGCRQSQSAARRSSNNSNNLRTNTNPMHETS